MEYSRNTSHEDLARARVLGTRMPYLTPVDPYTDDDHGTAVLGVLAATPKSTPTVTRRR